MSRLPAPRDLIPPRRMAIAREDLQAIAFEELYGLLFNRGDTELGAMAAAGTLARRICDRADETKQ